MQKLGNLGGDGACFLGHSAVDELANDGFAVKRIGLAMIRLSFDGGGDCGFEPWIAATIGSARAYFMAVPRR